MAQSLHIGLQGPFTNLPFGIFVPSILIIRYCILWGFRPSLDSKSPYVEAQVLREIHCIGEESLPENLAVLTSNSCGEDANPIRVKYVSWWVISQDPTSDFFFVSRKNESSMNHIVVLQSWSRVTISYLEMEIKAHISTRFPVFTILGGHHYWWSNLLWKNHCIAFFSHWSTFSGWGLLCPGSLQ